LRHVVSVVSVAPPTISWRCPRCPCSEFVCSERFRMNTHAKLADIWLIYRCARCDATKNLTIVERRPVTRISPSLVDAAMRNDPVAARRFARDLHLLRRAGVQVLRGDRVSLSEVARSSRRVQLHFAEPLLVRLDDVLSQALGVSRRQLRTLDASGRLRLHPPAPLSRLRCTTTTDVTIDLDGERPEGGPRRGA
jgi:hypothetical protein